MLPENILDAMLKILMEKIYQVLFLIWLGWIWVLLNALIKLMRKSLGMWAFNKEINVMQLMSWKQLKLMILSAILPVLYLMMKLLLAEVLMPILLYCCHKINPTIPYNNGNTFDTFHQAPLLGIKHKIICQEVQFMELKEKI